MIDAGNSVDSVDIDKEVGTQKTDSVTDITMEITPCDAGNEIMRVGGHITVACLLALVSQFDPFHAALAAPPAAVLVEKLMGNPGQRRRVKWLRELGDSLTTLSERVDGVEISQKLTKRFRDEEFVTVVQEATRIALATHEQEKVRALRNAVLHTALKDIDMAEELRLRFTKLLDAFGPTHFDILSFAVLPSAWMKTNDIPLPIESTDYDPGKRIQNRLKASPMFSIALGDLKAQGFLDQDPYVTIQNRHLDRAFSGNLTDSMGTLFYNFINDPEALKETFLADKEKSPAQ